MSGEVRVAGAGLVFGSGNSDDPTIYPPPPCLPLKPALDSILFATRMPWVNQPNQTRLSSYSA